MPPIVQKYGGSSVASPQHLRRVAERIAKRVDQGNECVVVVSAMGKTTDELIALASEITQSPAKREYDMLLSTGEIVSSALLAMALREIGCPAIALTGAQAGVYTDETFGRARITEIDTTRVQTELQRDHIVIIAGFQGLSPEAEFTTLGRGGSDTSAVALAAALGAEQAEIYTDVDGIFTTDPRIDPNARKLHDIAHEEMLELAAQGAAVMHPRAVELGLLHQIPIMVSSSFNEETPGTLIREQVVMEPTNRVRGIALDNDVAALTLRAVADRPGIAAQIFGPLADAGISVDTIVQNASVERLTDLTFTVAHGDWQVAREITEPIAEGLGSGEVIVNHNLSKVSIVGTGMRSGVGYAATMFRALAEAEVNILEITTSEILITALVDANQGKLAVQVLHAAFKLDQPSDA
jgi:aspartate kinase